MSIVLKSEIDISAAPDTVWEILTNFEAYPIWNPFIISLKGDVKTNQYIEVTIHPPESKPMTFKPKILRFDPGKELRWIGKVGFTGVFDGEHAFMLQPSANGGTTFTQMETFKGILVPVFAKMLNKNTKQGFVQMNQKLKELSENPSK